MYNEKLINYLDNKTLWNLACVECVIAHLMSSVQSSEKIFYMRNENFTGSLTLKFYDVFVSSCLKISFIKNSMKHLRRNRSRTVQANAAFFHKLASLKILSEMKLQGALIFACALAFMAMIDCAGECSIILMWVIDHKNYLIGHSFEITEFIKFDESARLSSTTEFHAKYSKFPVFDNLIHLILLHWYFVLQEAELNKEDGTGKVQMLHLRQLRSVGIKALWLTKKSRKSFLWPKNILIGILVWILIRVCLKVVPSYFVYPNYNILFLYKNSESHKLKYKYKVLVLNLIMRYLTNDKTLRGCLSTLKTLEGGMGRGS